MATGELEEYGYKKATVYDVTNHKWKTYYGVKSEDEEYYNAK